MINFDGLLIDDKQLDISSLYLENAIYYVQPGGQLNCPPGPTTVANYTEGAPVQH